MTILKNIFRYVTAGILAVGLCAASGLPAQASAAKDTKQAPKNGRDYVNKMYFEMADAANAVYVCVAQKLPRDPKAQQENWHPSELMLCKPQQQTADQKFRQLSSLDLEDPMLMWGNKEEQERTKRELAKAVDYLKDTIYIQRFLITMFDTENKSLVEAIFKVHKMAFWMQEKGDGYQKKLKSINEHLQRYKEKGDVEALKKLGSYLKYSNGRMTPVNDGVFLYDLDYHTHVLKRDGQKVLDLLSTFATKVSQLKAKTMGPTLTKLNALKTAKCYSRMTRHYDIFLNDLFPRLEFTIMHLFDLWGGYVRAETEEGKFLTMKGLSNVAPLLEPVSSYSYRESLQNALQYYIPNSVTIQNQRVILKDDTKK